MEIGKRIKHMRKQKGLTLDELASRSELSKGFLSQLENDLTSPSITTLDDILEALGSSLSEFFSEDKDERTVFHKNDFYVDVRDTHNYKLDRPQQSEASDGAHSCGDTGGRPIL